MGFFLDEGERCPPTVPRPALIGWCMGFFLGAGEWCPSSVSEPVLIGWCMGFCLLRGGGVRRFWCKRFWPGPAT
jgi:hypothetical protein